MLIGSISANSEVLVYGEYAVNDSAELTMEYIVEIVGAIASDNYYLDTGKDYKASVTFRTTNKVAPVIDTDDIISPQTIDTIKRTLIIFIVGFGLVVAVLYVNRRTRRRLHTRRVLYVALFSTVGLLALQLIAVNTTIFTSAQSGNLNDIIGFSSMSLNYENGDPGAWNVTKTAEWTGKGKAKITFHVDSIAVESNKKKDILLILDRSGSMKGERIERLREDAADLVDSVLDDPENTVGIVVFDTWAELMSHFDNDKATKINQITNYINPDSGLTNYYKALKTGDSLIQIDGIRSTEDRDLIILMLTDGYPEIDTPNEVEQYHILKQKYPYASIHAIQYEMDREILDALKVISDRQFVAYKDSLRNVLYEAIDTSEEYDKFVLTDIINNDIFIINEDATITADWGSVSLTNDGDGKQKVTWDLSAILHSGLSANLTIEVSLKEEYYSSEELLRTNVGEQIEAKIDGILDETVIEDASPVLRNNYTVSYEANSPSDCSVSGIPNAETHLVYDTVEISDATPTCSGYNFDGFELITTNLQKLNDDYIRMPEHDVVFRATWSKPTIEVNMDGEVYFVKTLYNMIARESVGSDATLNFNTKPTAAEVYTYADSENNQFPVYYYRGPTTNNNLIFAGYCWKMVRTTDTGGVKILYNGIADGSMQCADSNRPYVDSVSSYSYSILSYMYGVAPTITTSSELDGVVFGNDVTWNGRSYTLKDTCTVTQWADNNDDISQVSQKYHYTCKTTGTTCNTVYYGVAFSNIVNVSSRKCDTRFMTLTNGDNINTMMGKIAQNTTDSRAKTIVDQWYESNLASHSDKIEDTVYCGDRTIDRGILYSKDEDDPFASEYSTIYNSYGRYASFNRLGAYDFSNAHGTPTERPTLNCSRNDSYSKSAAIGNGALTYPIALLSMDEVLMAGASNSSYNGNTYIGGNVSYGNLTMTPGLYDASIAFYKNRIYAVNNKSTSIYYVRPVISLVSDITFAAGDGSLESPYIIED